MNYHQLITEATGVTDRADLEAIEDNMRNIIFHSTLDWLTKAQFKKGAREAWEIVQMMRDPAIIAQLNAEMAAEAARYGYAPAQL